MIKYLTLGTLLISFTSSGQDSSSIDLSEVSITANIIATELKETARNISIINAKTIAESPVRSLDGVLQYALNIDVRSRSPMGVQSDISIRGGHFDQTLILIDGVKMNDPQTGHHSLNIPIPIEMIERIEVLQGGASRVFGPAAFAGVIHIITKKELSETARVNLAVGENGLLRTAGQVGIKKNKVRAIGNAEWIQSNGYAYNTSFKKYNLHGMLDFDTQNGFVSVQAGGMKNDFGAANFYFPSFYDQSEIVSSEFAAIKWQSNFTNNLSSTVLASYRKHNDVYDFNNYLENDLERVNFHQSDVLALEWKARYLTDFGATAFGIELREEGIKSNRLGEELKKPIAVKGFEGVFYSNGFKRRNAGVFVEQQKRINKWYLAGGALFNYNNQFGFQVYPGLDISYEIDDLQSLYGSVNRSLRFPTFTEQYLNTSTVVGNPDLKAEKAIFYELGYKLANDKQTVGIATFYKNGDDAIDKVKRPELPKPTMENINDVNFFGIEVNYGRRFNKWFRKIDLNYAYLLADKKEEGYQSFYTLNYLTHKLSAGVNIAMGNKVSLQTWYTFKKREGSYQFSSTDPIIPYDPVHLLDLRIAYTGKFAQLYIDGTNVLGYEYYEFGFVEQPKRWITAGFSIGF